MTKPRVRVPCRRRPDLTVVPLSRPAVAEVVERIDSLRTMAADGLITDVAVAAVRPDGSVTTAYSFSRNAVALVGALQIVQRRVLDAVQR